MFLTAPEWLPQVRRGGKRQREAEETRDRLEEALNLIRSRSLKRFQFRFNFNYDSDKKSEQVSQESKLALTS